MTSLMRYRPLGDSPEDPRLGRFIPDDWAHVERFGFGALGIETPATVNRTLKLPSWHWTHDQGQEGSCVGHGTAMERAITNYAQAQASGVKPYVRRYDPLDLWNEAKRVDEWPDTNPGDDNGTSVRAAYDVLRDRGARRIGSTGVKLGADGRPVIAHPESEAAPDLAEGAVVNRWATTVDEMRAAIASGVPVTIGITWYEGFDRPQPLGTSDYILSAPLGRVRGGHCVCLYGASDRRQAFRVKNSWGRSYPLVWLPYDTMTQLLDEEGEVAVVTDR